MEKWDLDGKFFLDRKFSQNFPKVNFQWDTAKAKFGPRFRIFIKSWIFDEKLWLIKNSTKIALKSISIDIEQKQIWYCQKQFRAISGCIRPLRVINNRFELLNAVSNHLKTFRGFLEPFRAFKPVFSLFRAVYDRWTSIRAVWSYF